jgi:hypothetical protein
MKYRLQKIPTPVRRHREFHADFSVAPAQAGCALRKKQNINTA